MLHHVGKWIINTHLWSLRLLNRNTFAEIICVIWYFSSQYKQILKNTNTNSSRCDESLRNTSHQNQKKKTEMKKNWIYILYMINIYPILTPIIKIIFVDILKVFNIYILQLNINYIKYNYSNLLIWYYII